MDLLINISKEGKISLILEKNKKSLANFSWLDQRDLMEKLLPQLEKFLKREKVKLTDLKKVKVSSAMGENCSTTRIATAQAEAINYCLTSHWHFPGNRLISRLAVILFQGWQKN